MPFTIISLVYLPLRAPNFDFDPACPLTFPFLASSALEDVASILRHINVSILFYYLLYLIPIQLIYIHLNHF